MNFRIEREQEEDGRWLAEAPELPGVLADGTNPEEAMARVAVPRLSISRFTSAACYLLLIHNHIQ